MRKCDKHNEVLKYTDRWNGFQFRSPTYLNGHFAQNEYDLVLWQTHKPLEVIDAKTMQKKIVTESCFSVANLVWNEKDQSFDFRSVGLRYLEYNVDGLDQWVLDFAKKKEEEYRNCC